MYLFVLKSDFSHSNTEYLEWYSPWSETFNGGMSGWKGYNASTPKYHAADKHDTTPSHFIMSER